MKTTISKETKNNTKEGKDLRELATLWNHESDNGVKYLSGTLSEEFQFNKVIAFYNTTKKNEKEPDIRVYSVNDENKKEVEIISLWIQESKENKKYYSGLTNDKEKVIAFISNKDDIKVPYIKVYFK